MEQKLDVGCLIDLINCIRMPHESQHIKEAEIRRCESLAKSASKILPVINYPTFSEIILKLDSNGNSFDSYLSKQITFLYFLLRLAPLYKSNISKTDITDFDVQEIFPVEMLENGVVNITNSLLLNYLVESWNRYVDYGGTQNSREAISQSHLYQLCREVVRVYGWWVWPFFYHYESIEHVDMMTKLVEDSDGCIPISAGLD